MNDTTTHESSAAEKRAERYTLEKGEAFYIPNWNDHFENAQTRRTQHLNQVMMPTRGNKGEHRRILSMEGGYQALAIWHLLIQFASECPQRGLLIKESGVLDYGDLAFELGVPEADIRAAFKILGNPKIGWVDITDCPKSLLVSGTLRKGRNKKVHPRVLMVWGQEEGPEFTQDVILVGMTGWRDDGPFFGIQEILMPDFAALYEMDKTARLAARGVSEHGVDTPEMPAYPDVDYAMGVPEEEETEEKEPSEAIT